MDPYEFAQVAKSFNFTGIEYVTALYDNIMKVRDGDMSKAITFWARKNKKLAEINDINNVLIMIDEIEGLS